MLRPFVGKVYLLYPFVPFSITTAIRLYFLREIMMLRKQIKIMDGLLSQQK